ncbi:dihydrodipicolinate synthase family protein [Verrucomicrobiota bacterium]
MDMKLDIQRLVAAVHTPMHPDGSVNTAAVPDHVARLVDEGVGGLFVCGSTGEFPSLTVEERQGVAEAYRAAAPGGVPVIVHVGHNCIRDAGALAAHASGIGATAIAAAPPSYFKPDDVPATVACCAKISAAAPDMPFFYYHIPALTGVDLPLADFLGLAGERIPALAGVKYTNEDMSVFLDCLRTYGEDYLLMSGRDQMLLSAIASGARAAVGTTYNYAAGLYLRMWDAFERGDMETARLCQHRSVLFIKLLRKYGGLAASKAFMKLIGMDCGPLRLPFLPLSDAEEQALKDELTRIGFFDWRNGA